MKKYIQMLVLYRNLKLLVHEPYLRDISFQWQKNVEKELSRNFTKYTSKTDPEVECHYQKHQDIAQS